MLPGMTRALIAVAALVACGGGKPAKREDGGTPTKPADAAVVEIAKRPLGLADLDAYQWRKRPGHPIFRDARTAENKDDWATAVTACTKALAADPTHLEAAWLLAVGFAKTGKLADV